MYMQIKKRRAIRFHRFFRKTLFQNVEFAGGLSELRSPRDDLRVVVIVVVVRPVCLRPVMRRRDARVRVLLLFDVRFLLLSIASSDARGGDRRWRRVLPRCWCRSRCRCCRRRRYRCHRHRCVHLARLVQSTRAETRVIKIYNSKSSIIKIYNSTIC